MKLTAEQAIGFSNSLIPLLLVGFAVFAFSMLSMIFLFGWSIKDAMKNTRGLAVFLVLSFLMPFLSFRIYQQVANNSSSQAAPAVVVSQITVSKADDGLYYVDFNTSEAVLAYLEYTDEVSKATRPILPAMRMEKSKNHSFVIDKVGEKGGIAVVIINGKKYSVNGQPIKIK
jgi:hypothetical protein